MLSAAAVQRCPRGHRSRPTLRADLAGPSCLNPQTTLVMFVLRCIVTITQEQAHLLLDVIEHAARQRLFTQGTQSRGLGGFAEACEELIRWRAK